MGYLIQVIASPGCGEIGMPVWIMNCETSQGAMPLVVELLDMAILSDGSPGRHAPPAHKISKNTGTPSSTVLPCASVTTALAVVSRVPSLLSIDLLLMVTPTRFTGPEVTVTSASCAVSGDGTPLTTVSAHAATVTGPGCVPERSVMVAKPAVSEMAKGSSRAHNVVGLGDGVAPAGGRGVGRGRITAPGALWAATTGER